MTGLSVDTLRAWERRYEAVVPTRNDRGRVYSEAQVARLKRLDELVKLGHAIGTIARATDDELDQMLRGADAHAARPEPPPVANLEALTSALDRYDLEAVEATLNRYAVLLPPRELVFSVVLPLLNHIGERWQSGRLRPSQEHLVSAVIRSMLGGSLRAIARPTGSPRVVFATRPAIVTNWGCCAPHCSPPPPATACSISALTCRPPTSSTPPSGRGPASSCSA